MPDLSFSPDGCACFKFSSKSIRYVLLALSPHVRESKRVLDSGFWILDSGFWILDSGFWILDSTHSTFSISGSGFLILCQRDLDSGVNREIPDSLSFIPDSKTQDSRFHGKNLLIFIFHKLLYSGIPSIRHTLLKLETPMPHLRQEEPFFINFT